MDDYKQWDRVNRGHVAGAFPTQILRQIEHHFADLKIENSAETGCGKTTILLSNYSQSHTVFTIDDRHEGESSSINFFMSCPLTKTERLDFVFGPTQKTLPAYRNFKCYDLIFIDGPHGFPFPELEYFFFYPHLRMNGLLIIDDVNIPTIARLADFVAEDDMFEEIALISGTAIFRRTEAPTFDPYADGWWQQNYNRRRVSSKRDIFLPSQCLGDRFSSLQLDRRLRGEPVE